MHKIILAGVALLLVALPFHAFLFTWFKSFFWTDSWTVLVQAWKEILLVGIGATVSWRALTQPSWWRSPLTLLPLALLLLAGGYLLLGPGALEQKIFGFRQVALLLVAFLVGTLLYFSAKEQLLLNRLLVLATGVVAVFGLALLFVLPHDFLASFGYSTVVSTWLPGGNLPMYHLVGGTDLIRAQSTFAGPNQLGAWLLVVLPVVALSAVSDHRRWHWLPRVVLALGVALLIVTYSRAAWLGACAIAGIFILRWLFQTYTTKQALSAVAGLTVLGIVAVGSLFVFDTTRELVLREASSSEHLTQTVAAAKLAAAEPLGLGLGSTAGGAQRYGDGLTPENDYLGIALQLGWLGATLFIAWMVLLGRALWHTKSPILYGLVGVMVIMLFLHPLTDSATAITLMILAGLAVSPAQA